LLGRQDVAQPVDEALTPFPFVLDPLSVRLAFEFDDLVRIEAGCRTSSSRPASVAGSLT